MARQLDRVAQQLMSRASKIQLLSGVLVALAKYANEPIVSTQSEIDKTVTLSKMSDHLVRLYRADGVDGPQEMERN